MLAINHASFCEPGPSLDRAGAPKGRRGYVHFSSGHDGGGRDERVLDGLRDTYNSLSVPISPTVRGIQLLKDVVLQELGLENTEAESVISEPFSYMCRALSEQNISK